MKRHCVIATRGSALALWQANAVRESLTSAWPGLTAELLIVKTTGDKTLDVPLHEVGDRAMFTKELEQALLAKDADLCVHSMKDVPSSLPDGCEIAAMLPRADARDVLVCGPRLTGCSTLAQLPAGTRVGTGSLRRAAQVHAAFPQVQTLDIRGNVDTRLRKAFGDEYDGVILAAAGLERMGEQDKISSYLSVADMVPAAGQGAIGIEIRSDDDERRELLGRIDDAKTHECVAAERFVLDQLGGSCKVPIGVYARYEASSIVMDAIVLSLDGTSVARAHESADADQTSLMQLAQAVLGTLRAQGADGILAQMLDGEGVR